MVDALIYATVRLRLLLKIIKQMAPGATYSPRICHPGPQTTVCTNPYIFYYIQVSI